MPKSKEHLCERLMWGLSAGICTVITQIQRNQTIEFSWGALLFGCIVSFIVRNKCLSAYRRIPNVSYRGVHTKSCSHFLTTFQGPHSIFKDHLPGK